MSQSKIPELNTILTMANIYATINYLINRYGVADFPEEVEVLLKRIALFNHSLNNEQVPLFLQLLKVATGDLPKFTEWMQENQIERTVLDFYIEIDNARKLLEQYGSFKYF